MALTNQKEPDKLDIPHEPGEWIEASALSWSVFQEAEDVATSRAAERSALILKSAGPDAVRALAGMDQADAETPAGDKYDRRTVLQGAIKSWSYSEPPTPENIDALDPETASWLFDVVIAANTRSKTLGEKSSADSGTTTLDRVAGQVS